MKRPLAYVTAAWCGSDHENAKLAAQYCRTVYKKTVVLATEFLRARQNISGLTAV